MLVLTRKQQEKIQIGDDIVITILKTKGKTVRIGVEAPSTVPVLRGELAVRVREEEAAKTDGAAGPSSNAPSAKPPVVEDGIDQASRSGCEWNAEGGASRVSLQRVPRSRVATVLGEKLGPPMTDSHGPLRAMLDRRAGVAL